MSIFNLAFNTGRLRSILADTPGRGVLADRIINLGRELAAGMIDQITLTADDTPLNASGTVTIAGGNGNITVTINGVAIVTAFSVDDTTTAALIAAAINASVNALVAGLVTATSLLGVVTITAARKGKAGNAITTAASGTGATANQVRLTAGSDGTTTSMTF